jgi:hypothetical protein
MRVALYFKSKPVNIPKITILLDNGYHPQKIMEELKKENRCNYDEDSLGTIT